jgi:CCR4-NOT transcriptional regulation complex NOT5 subunit
MPVHSLFQMPLILIGKNFKNAHNERLRRYLPNNPYPTPSYYPHTPLTIFESPMMCEKFDIDTLFFIFYYQSGTYQQYSFEIHFN